MHTARLDLLDRSDSDLKGRKRMAKAKAPACDNCYFGKNMLFALNLGRPCPTYRPADRGLEPERQLAFVFRAERTRAVYAFPQPR